MCSRDKVIIHFSMLQIQFHFWCFLFCCICITLLMPFVLLGYCLLNVLNIYKSNTTDKNQVNMS